MRLPIVISILALGAAGAASAQQLTQLFISPMGEPFRATDAQPYPSAAWFAGADANKDGTISRDEFRADAQRFFKALDVNGDGMLTEEEIVRYERQVAPEIVDATLDTSGTESEEDAQGHKKPVTLFATQGATFYGVINSPEPVRAADVDFNRKVTLQEWMDAADRRFRLLRPEGKDGIRLSDLPETPFQIQRKAKH